MKSPRTPDWGEGFRDGMDSTAKAFVDALVACLSEQDVKRVMTTLEEQDAKRRRSLHIVRPRPAEPGE